MIPMNRLGMNVSSLSRQGTPIFFCFPFKKPAGILYRGLDMFFICIHSLRERAPKFYLPTYLFALVIR